MVRRLLLTALLAALAVALPVAAEEDPAFGLPSGSDPAGCLSSDLSCVGPLDVCDPLLGSCWGGESQSASLSAMHVAESMECRPWDLNTPSTNTSIWETLIVDPDGCIRSFVRRTLDRLPPFATDSAIASPLVNDLLPWP